MVWIVGSLGTAIAILGELASAILHRITLRRENQMMRFDRPKNLGLYGRSHVVNEKDPKLQSMSVEKTKSATPTVLGFGVQKIAPSRCIQDHS